MKVILSSLYVYEPIFKKLDFVLITTITVPNSNKKLHSRYRCLQCKKTTLIYSLFLKRYYSLIVVD